MCTNQVFKVKNNGWIFKTCKMARGIRQEYPILAMPYIFIAEILALELKNNNTTNSFQFKDMH